MRKRGSINFPSLKRATHIKQCYLNNEPVTSLLLETCVEISDDVWWSYDNASRMFTWMAATEAKLNYALTDINTIEDWTARIRGPRRTGGVNSSCFG